MSITNHDFFDPIIPYITEMDSNNQTVSIRIPRDIILNHDEIHKYFGNDLKIEAVTMTLRDGFKTVLSKALSGTIKDKDLFNYLHAFFTNPTLSFQTKL